MKVRKKKEGWRRLPRKKRGGRGLFRLRGCAAGEKRPKEEHFANGHGKERKGKECTKKTK